MYSGFSKEYNTGKMKGNKAFHPDLQTIMGTKEE